jgi:hypothetical protein
MPTLRGCHARLPVIIAMTLIALAASQPAVARQSPAQTALREAGGAVLDGQSAGGESGDPMVVLQDGLSEDAFRALTMLLGNSDDPQTCATDLADALQSGHLSAEASNACGDTLSTAVAILEPYVACPGGDASECDEPQSIVIDLSPDDVTRGAPQPPLNVSLSRGPISP